MAISKIDIWLIHWLWWAHGHPKVFGYTQSSYSTVQWALGKLISIPSTYNKIIEALPQPEKVLEPNFLMTTFPFSLFFVSRTQDRWRPLFYLKLFGDDWKETNYHCTSTFFIRVLRIFFVAEFLNHYYLMRLIKLESLEKKGSLCKITS